MDIKEDDDFPMILSGPFKKSTRMTIDIDDGLMKVRVQNEKISFNLIKAMKHSKENKVCFKMDATDEAIMDVQKQVHIPTLKERALTYAFNELNAGE